jgi:hypothetical protein
MLRSKIIVLLGILIIPGLLYAQHETITIKSHSRSSKSAAPPARVFLTAELDGQRVVLQCVLSHDDCKELPAGEFEIDRLLAGEGSYKGCPNVDIYKIGADRSKEEPLGEYCLLNEH